MENEEVIIVGAGPCGLACAIALQEKGFSPLLIEKGNVVNALYHYPTHQQFFSTSEKLEIGMMPFVTVDRKPKRNDALSYYREVVKRKQLRIHTYEKVVQVRKNNNLFTVTTVRHNNKRRTYQARFAVIATGYYDHPNMLGVPGENGSHVFHYFKEAHPYFNKNVVVIGGKNSAVDTTLELEKAGANVTVLYRGREFSKSIKPWILPEFESLIGHGKIKMVFEADIVEITDHTVVYKSKGKEFTAEADFVFAMIGYHPDHSFLSAMGVEIDEETGRPLFNSETMETNVPGIFIAGVIAAGNEANEIFIENGRLHGEILAKEILNRQKINL